MMNAAFSWAIVMLLFVCAWLAADRIGRVTDWVLDHMGWGVQGNLDSKSTTSTTDCPCGQDRSYHDRKASSL